jgi:hypothetical protein
MLHTIKFLRLLSIVMICFLISPNTALGQKTKTLDYPDAMTPKDWRLSLGVSSVALPTDIVLETASIRWPLIRFAGVMGLPSNFVLDTKIATEIVTNHFELGGKWVYEFNNRLHADAGLDFAYFFGRLQQFEFDTKIHGWFTYPSVAIGYDFGPLTVTLRGTISYINSLSSINGEVESSFDVNKFNGFFYRVSLEQPFYKFTTIGLAFQMSYLKLYYPEWPLFPAIDRYYWIPELQVWLTL